MNTTATIMADWRDMVVFVGEPWTRAKLQRSVPGICHGYEVEHPEYPGRTAYFKPCVTSEADRAQVAAREKIAADLAYDLGIPSPPVLLYDAPEVHPNYPQACLSLVMFEKQESWGTVQHQLDETTARAAALRRLVPAAAARVLAFGTWILADDCHGKSNSIFGWNPSTGEEDYVFFDYAHGLGSPLEARAMVETFEKFGKIPFPNRMLALLDRKTLLKTIEDIETFSDKKISDIVSRIPHRFMPTDVSEALVDALVVRRPLVHALLSDYL